MFLFLAPAVSQCETISKVKLDEAKAKSLQGRGIEPAYFSFLETSAIEHNFLNVWFNLV